MKSIVRDFRGVRVTVLRDQTEGETFVTLESDVFGNPLRTVTVDGNLLIRGTLKTYHRDRFGELDNPV